MADISATLATRERERERERERDRRGLSWSSRNHEISSTDQRNKENDVSKGAEGAASV